MNSHPYKEPFLVSQFREFYTEVIRLKSLINSNSWVSSATPGAEPDGNGNGSKAAAGTLVYYPEFDDVALGSFPPQRQGASSLALRTPTLMSVDLDRPPLSDQTKIVLLVWQSLLAFFRRNGHTLPELDRLHAKSYFDAQYVMAAFADEVFINLNWVGKRAWTTNLLESTLFQSHVAGEVFFEKVDQLLCERDPAEKSLAAVYLMALSLGFQGKYRNVNDRGRLSHYRRELFAFAFSQSSDLANESKLAFPEAYVQSRRQVKKRKLTNPRFWVALCGIVFLSYLLVSHVLWLNLTSRLERTNNEIIETANRLDSIPKNTR